VRLLLPRQLEDPDLRDLYDVEPGTVRAGMLMSADGVVAHDGRSGPLQRPGDGEVFAALRAVADVVLVGAGTARGEGYGPVHLSDADLAWRRAHGRDATVPVAVVSRSLDLAADARWRTSTALVVTCAASPVEERARLARTVEVLVAGDEDVDLAAAVTGLAERGLGRVLCEGGPRLLADLVRVGLLDELCATVAPVLAGAGQTMLGSPLDLPVDLRLVHLLQEHDTLLGRWQVVR
jgi:riboflavin biosynthesis pyrimidine reductase